MPQIEFDHFSSDITLLSTLFFFFNFLFYRSSFGFLKETLSVRLFVYFLLKSAGFYASFFLKKVYALKSFVFLHYLDSSLCFYNLCFYNFFILTGLLILNFLKSLYNIFIYILVSIIKSVYPLTTPLLSYSNLYLKSFFLETSFKKGVIH